MEPHKAKDDAPPVDTCTACGTTAPPDESGLCSNPTCRCIRKGAKLAQKYGPVNKTRRQQLHARFVRDYRPATTIDEIHVQQLANIGERLSVVTVGTMDHVRLLQASQTIVSTLEASRQARGSATPTTDLENLSSDELLARARKLVTLAETVYANEQKFDAANNHPLIDGRTKSERAIAREQQVLDDLRAEAARASQDSSAITEDDVFVVPDDEDPCTYCHQSAADCQDMRETRPDIFEALHADAPEFVEKRKKQATAEMLESLRRKRLGLV